MENILLLNVVESVLGKGFKTSKGNYSFHCPFCNHRKPKLEVNIVTTSKGENPYNCWVCHTKGRSVLTLFKKLNVPKDKIIELSSIIKSSPKQEFIEEDNNIKLPKEFKSLINDKTIEARHAKAYLKKRGLTEEDIIKYNIGYSINGRYSDSIIIPSYDSNYKLNYFISRKIVDSNRKYDSPKCDKNIVIGLESNINWKTPIILCEGIFDAIAIKRNAIPLFGKTISKALMKKLVESDVKTVYLALDQDAIKDALDHAMTLLNYGKSVYLVEMDNKDPSELGFEKFTKLLHNAHELTLLDLMMKKMNL
jgi:DNA primase